MTSIRLKRLTLSGFGSFQAEQKLLLDGPPGLVLLCGINEVDTKLEGNGVGKSTLFDALTFGLTGRTSDGSRGPDLVNDDSSTATIKIELQRDGIPHVINRTIKPNSLTLHQRGEPPITVEQHVIDDLLGVKLPTYIATVHHSQALDSFLDMGSTGQLELLSELLELDQYVTASDIASKTAKQHSESTNSLKVEIAEQRGKVSVLKQQITDTEEKEIKYLRRRYRFLKDCDREIMAWQKQLTVEKRKRADVRSDFDELDLDEERKLKNNSEKLLHDLTKLRAESTLLRTRRAQLYTALKDTLACPTCGRAFEDAERAENHAKAELKNIDGQLKGFEGTIKEMAVEHGNATRLYDNACVHNNDQREILRAKANELDAAIIRIETTVNEQQKRKQEMIDEPNPYIDEIADVQDRLDAIETQLAKLNLRLSLSMRREALYSYWTKAFKDLRLTVVENALLQLTLQVNNALDQLGLPGWRLSVEAEGISRTGNVKRGMRVAVLIGDRERAVARLSFGERQRLRLAVAMGVGDMIQAVTGSSFNLELFDEPTSWLSPAGVEQLLAVLSERALATGRRIFLADHRSLAWPFQSTITVVKDEQGATLQ